MSDKPLVTVEDLTVKFVSREATVHAVNGVVHAGFDHVTRCFFP